MGRSRTSISYARVLACAGALTLLTAACGDDDDDGAADTTSASPTTAVVSSDPGTTAAEPGSSTTADPDAGNPYSAVFIGDSTGGFAASGTNGLAGFSAAVDAINSSGGVNGHPIEFEAIDSQTSPTGVQAAGLQAVESEPVAIVGCLLSSQVPALANTIGGAGIPTVVGCSNNEDLIHPVTPWYYQISADSQIYAEAFVGAAPSLVGGPMDGKKIGIVGLTSAGVDGIISASGPAIEEAGGEVVHTERTGLTIASFDAQAANMVAAEPDLVWIIDQSASTVIVGKALRTAGYTGPILIADGAASDVVMGQIGGEGLYGQRWVIAPEAGSDAYKAAEKADAIDSIQDQAFSKSWVAAYVIAAGLEHCGFPCDSEGLIEAMDSMEPIDIADVTTGPVGFSADNHVGVKSVGLYAWDPAKNASVASGSPIVFGG